MLAQIVGSIDLPTACFLIALCGGFTVVITTSIAKRRSRQELTQEFELAKIKEQNQRELNMYTTEQKFILETKKVSEHLITSHRSSDSEG